PPSQASQLPQACLVVFEGGVRQVDFQSRENVCRLESVMRKDKKQVIGDEIGDDQIKLFLDFEPVDATSPSLHKLIKAYRGLRIDDFERFLGFFKDAGLDLDGKDEHGQTFVDLIKDQRNADEYIELIENARG
ncbi:PA4642 family protein, partial [Klebsiella michiganensis]